jgi:hypothetical protein
MEGFRSWNRVRVISMSLPRSSARNQTFGRWVPGRRTLPPAWVARQAMKAAGFVSGADIARWDAAPTAHAVTGAASERYKPSYPPARITTRTAAPLFTTSGERSAKIRPTLSLEGE